MSGSPIARLYNHPNAMRSNRTIPQDRARIVLVGFMGAGKSTVGPILAERLGWRFADSDHHLQARAGMAIAELFSTVGEAHFRRMEAEAVAELHREGGLVLALGGGAIESEATRSLLARSSDTFVVFLKAPLKVLIERCENQPDAAVRPVLRQRDTLAERFQARLPHYERAHLTVETKGLSAEAVADSILDSLLQAKPEPHAAAALTTDLL